MFSSLQGSLSSEGKASLPRMCDPGVGSCIYLPPPPAVNVEPRRKNYYRILIASAQKKVERGGGGGKKRTDGRHLAEARALVSGDCSCTASAGRWVKFSSAREATLPRQSRDKENMAGIAIREFLGWGWVIFFLGGDF